jgi:hypothetical protein
MGMPTWASILIYKPRRLALLPMEAIGLSAAHAARRVSTCDRFM